MHKGGVVQACPDRGCAQCYPGAACRPGAEWRKLRGCWPWLCPSRPLTSPARSCVTCARGPCLGQPGAVLQGLPRLNRESPPRRTDGQPGSHVGRVREGLVGFKQRPGERAAPRQLRLGGEPAWSRQAAVRASVCLAAPHPACPQGAAPSTSPQKQPCFYFLPPG